MSTGEFAAARLVCGRSSRLPDPRQRDRSAPIGKQRASVSGLSQRRRTSAAASQAGGEKVDAGEPVLPAAGYVDPPCLAATRSVCVGHNKVDGVRPARFLRGGARRALGRRAPRRAIPGLSGQRRGPTASRTWRGESVDGRVRAERPRARLGSRVSRAHAQLEALGDNWTLVDDGLSRNGSFLKPRAGGGTAAARGR